MVGFLSHQTNLAVKSHHELTASVLKDYAQMAVDEFERRYYNVMFYGIYPALGAIAQQPFSESLMNPEDLPSVAWSKTENERKRFSTTPRLSRTYFRYNTDISRFEQTGKSLPSTVAKQLMFRMKSTLDYQGVPVYSTYIKKGRRDFNFVFRRVSSHTFVGMVLDNRANLDWLAYFIESGPILPNPLRRTRYPQGGC